MCHLLQWIAATGRENHAFSVTMPLDLAAAFLFSRALFSATNQFRSTRGGVHALARACEGGQAALARPVARAPRGMAFDPRGVEVSHRCKWARID
jgi:hypothetical protein